MTIRAAAATGLAASLWLFPAACASALQRPASQPLPDLARRVTDFAVTDSTGAAYDHPFLGGFDVPRPQLVDIDRDGDLDLFVQEESGRVMLFERTGPAAGPPAYAWRTDAFEGLDVGEWYRFADLDGDGDQDLLAERRLSAVRAWGDRGPGASPRFASVADTLRDTEGEAVYADRQNIPNVVDLDCDGLLDLMLGRVDGTVTRYEATAPWSGAGAPTFAFVTDEFAGIRIVAQIVPSLRHGANTLVFADHEGDGDKDLFWGDFFEPGLLLLENHGSCEAPAYSSDPVPWPVGGPIATSGYNAPTFGDVDGDGDEDAVVGVLGGAYNPVRTAAANLYLMRREASGWTLVTERLIGQVDVGSESVPALGDLDGDGDPDLLLGNKIDPRDLRAGRIYRFENTGAPGRPAFRLAGALPPSAAFHYAPALADLDADGDLDLVAGTWNQGIQLWRNEGTARAPRFEGPDSLVALTRGSHAAPALGDLDGDGDLDLVVGSESGETAVLWNEGGLRFAAAERRLELVASAAPAFADLDTDGDPDLLLGTRSGGLRYYENTGFSATRE